MASVQRREFVKQLGGAVLASTGVVNLAGSAGVRGTQGRKKIKIGQIGVGHAHAEKVTVYRRSDEYEVVGIVEPDAELRAGAEGLSAFKGLPWMTQEQLLNVPGLEAVVVETRVRDLLNTAETCVAAGKHVHLDKPAGASLPQFRRILEAAARQNLLLQMGYMYRYNPAVVLLREFLKKGRLGEPYEVHAVLSKIIEPERRIEMARSGKGGILFELGCHMVDLIVGLIGKPQQVHAFPLHSAGQDDGFPDNMLAVFTWPRVSATVRSSAMEVEAFSRRHLVVCGMEGTFHIQPIDNPAARVALSAAQGEYRKGVQDIQFPRYERYVADAADMAKIIRGEKKADFSYEHDLAVQETLLKACGLET
jgi:predicted dehydrogenase